MRYRLRVTWTTYQPQSWQLRGNVLTSMTMDEVAQRHICHPKNYSCAMTKFGNIMYIYGHLPHYERAYTTSVFDKKWHDFFTVLGSREGLNTNLNAHIWLIHHLLLPFINYDVQTWAAVWNNHPLARRDHIMYT